MPAKTHTTALRHIHQSLRELKDLPTPENPGVVADLLGEIRHIETLLGDWRRGLQAETEDGQGQAYEIVTRRKCKRTFNVARILLDVAQAGDTTLDDALFELQRRGAVKVTVKWTDLKKAFDGLGVSLTTAPREIADGDLDEAHVGEVWTEYTQTVAVKP